MMRLFLVLAFCFPMWLQAQSRDEQQIRAVMQQQQDDWNKGEIEAFMQGYWKSDSLMFIGSSGVTYGYENTRARYHRNYGSREKMGILKFDLLHVNRLSAKVFLVVGKWHLTRTIGDIGGHFSLVFRKVNGRWVISSDHTS